MSELVKALRFMMELKQENYHKSAYQEWCRVKPIHEALLKVVEAADRWQNCSFLMEEDIERELIESLAALHEAVLPHAEVKLEIPHVSGREPK